MKHSMHAAGRVAGIALAVAFASPAISATIVRPVPFPSRLVSNAARTAHSTGDRHARPNARRRDTPPCTTNAADAFIAEDDSQNIAGGKNSTAVAGSDNFACGDYSAVLGGQINDVFPAASNAGIVAGEYDVVKASAAFIGAGASNTASGTDAFIGAGFTNAASGADASIVAGENGSVTGNGSALGGGGYTDPGDHSNDGNSVSGDNSFAGAGSSNTIAADGAFLGSGQYNTISANATDAVVAGGEGNTATGFGSAIGSGYGNQVDGRYGVIVDGELNYVGANDGFIGSGNSNDITTAATYGAIAGGTRNTVSATYAAVEGGYGNTASGAYAIVAGGDGDTAGGTLSLAAGYHADAAHNGSFVWSDYVSGSATAKDTAVNQFVVRSSGGVAIYSNEAMTSGVRLAAGSGTWSSLSDRNAKTDIVPLDDGSILAKVSALPIGTWRYKTERGVRHVGPMAQDFFRAFGVGEDDRHIASIDEDGIALAAVRALHREVLGKDAELAAEHKLIETQRAQLLALAARVERLETK